MFKSMNFQRSVAAFQLRKPDHQSVNDRRNNLIITFTINREQIIYAYSNCTDAVYWPKTRSITAVSLRYLPWLLLDSNRNIAPTLRDYESPNACNFLKNTKKTSSLELQWFFFLVLMHGSETSDVDAKRRYTGLSDRAVSICNNHSTCDTEHCSPKYSIQHWGSHSVIWGSHSVHACL